MIRKRTIEEVRRFDIFKLSIILVLLVLIFLMLLRDNNAATVASTDDEASTSEVDESTAADASLEEPGADEAYPAGGDTDGQEETDTGAEAAYPADGDTADQEDTASQSGEPAMLTPAPGAELGVGPNIFSGSGQPDDIVRILANGSEVGQTTVDADGNWYLEADLEAGETVLEVQSIDADGTVIASAPNMSIVVVTGEQAARTPDLIVNESNLYAGSVELGGTGEPGNQIVVFVAGVEVVTAEVQDDGSWNLPLDLDAGTHMIDLQSMDETGNVVSEAGPFEVIVQEARLPTVALPDDDVFTGGMTLGGTGQPGTRVRLFANETVIGEADVDDSGSYTIEVNLAVGRYNIDVATVDKSGIMLEIVPALSLPVLARIRPELTFADPEMPEFDPFSGLIEWHGTADPEAQLVLVVDGEEIAQTTADNDGGWSLLSDLEPGTHEVSLRQLNIDGKVVNESVTVTVELSQKPPFLELPDYSFADSGADELERSIQMPAGNFEWSGQSSADESVAIIIDGEIVGTATTDEDGNWIITTNLETGDHELQLGSIDEDGNIINQSAVKKLKVVGAERPSMETPELDESGEGSVSGTAEPEATVSVTANGKVVGLTSADETGSWTLNVDLGLGTIEVQAQVLDEEGMVVLSSAKQTVQTGAGSESQEDHVINAADAEGEYTTLLSGLEAAGLTGQLAKSEAAFTLFAPTDAAFDALPDEVTEIWNLYPEAYKEIMFYLVLEGAYTKEQLAETEVLTTLAGTNIGITTDDETLLVNGVPVEEIVPAGFSVVYAIDQVILPPLSYQAQPPVIDLSGVSIFTGDYLTVVGTAEPGTTILLQVDGENFGELAEVDEDGFWQTADDISSGVHEIVAYMLDENGLLVAISQQVSLPVQ